MRASQRGKVTINTNVGNLKGGIALGCEIYLNPNYDIPLLAHELAHVGQYEQWGEVEYYTRAGVTQVKNLFSNQYRWEHLPDRLFNEYGMEQQGRIVQGCFSSSVRACGISPYRPPPKERQ